MSSGWEGDRQRYPAGLVLGCLWIISRSIFKADQSYSVEIKLGVSGVTHNVGTREHPECREGRAGPLARMLQGVVGLANGGSEKCFALFQAVALRERQEADRHCVRTVTESFRF